MICPHCGYLDGWSSETCSRTNGVSGSFYKLPVKLERQEHWETERTSLYACPECSKTFID